MKVHNENCWNSRLIFALGVAFAAPLLPIIGLESGGFHLIGGTSAGKTTTLKVAASVLGIKDIPHWRTTSNGLESIAHAHNHMMLPLDEIGQADPREVGNIAYMLGNGQGKTRMTKNLANRPPKKWQLIFLSSGEVGMGDYIAQAKLSLKGGQEVRMPDIPAIPPGSTTGVFENIHGCDSSKQFAQALEHSTVEQRGTAIDTFLTRLCQEIAVDSELGSTMTKRLNLIANHLAEGLGDSGINRVANRFALLQVALGMAHSYGLLPFPVDDIEWAISSIQRSQYTIHIPLTPPLETCYRKHENDLPTTESERWKENPIVEFWIENSVFDREFVKGVNKAALIEELQKRGWLEKGANGKNVLQKRVDGKRIWVYVFLPAAFDKFDDVPASVQ